MHARTCAVSIDVNIYSSSCAHMMFIHGNSGWCLFLCMYLQGGNSPAIMPGAIAAGPGNMRPGDWMCPSYVAHMHMMFWRVSHFIGYAGVTTTTMRHAKNATNAKLQSHLLSKGGNASLSQGFV